MVSSGSDKQAPSVAHCTCTRVYDLESGPDGILQQHQNCLDAYSGVVDGRSGGGVGHIRAMGFTAGDIEWKKAITHHIHERNDDFRRKQESNILVCVARKSNITSKNVNPGRSFWDGHMAAGINIWELGHDGSTFGGILSRQPIPSRD
ncbi:predicted protein [Aspergillus terreus NIH2624]|uniref:Uncharacterized protein n=1 Tax=Aspergillus terreus (strain NIH 2624 / FGSC A1156) TaxID=341663 RepID=Q0CWH0_ASPTN|nr:uncharacterized protein ATEG_01964 [Aspergillus terreus NIH2624]EAU36926.1 predicted protein [Aspergillus terreus NIH2624]